MFIAVLFTIDKTWKQPVFINELMEKENVIYVYNSAIEKKEILPFGWTTWTDLDSIMLSDKSQTEKDKYCIISLIRGIRKT